MKSGASDPFAEESQTADAERETSTGQDTSKSSSDMIQQRSADELGNSDRSSTQQSDTGEKMVMTQDERGFSRDQLPYILRREKVKDERPEVHQLFVQEQTHSAAIDAERELEDRIDDDLSRTDAREAIYRAGMQHLDDAERVLREWGYDL